MILQRSCGCAKLNFDELCDTVGSLVAPAEQHLAENGIRLSVT